MIWILAVITTISMGAPDVTINKVGVFTDEQKRETTRHALQESAEGRPRVYICVKHVPKDSPS